MLKKRYTIWLEGYAATGNSAPARYMGVHEGTCFEDACLTACRENFGPRETARYYDAERNTYWGMHFYSNEADARKYFG